MPTNQKTKPVRNLVERLGLPTDGSSGLTARDLAVEISGIDYDSRAVQPGHAFFCIEGQKMDGLKFIPDAVARGAACVFSQRAPENAPDVPVIVVPDTKLALALAADEFYDHPSRSMRLIGVTGTNGKTTTTHLVQHILCHAGKKAALIGTLGARLAEDDGSSTYIDMHHTTPQASDLQAMLAEMVQKRQAYVAMEVSSHALALARVGGCNFAVACLTNVTQDHLDFHRTMENYWKSKRMLFEQLVESKQSNKTAVINLDDPIAREFMNAVTGDVKLWTYGWEAPADAHVVSAEFDFKGTRLSLNTPAGPVTMRLKLNGRFNVYNVMSAVLIALAEGIDLQTCKEALENFGGVPGRFESVGSASPDQAHEEPLCIVDYAHTPDGLDNVLKAARALVPQGGRLIVVFGCGGDRDSSKRPQMGEIAESRADDLVVTSDNPRSEDPQKIIADILAGIRRMKNVDVEPDRTSAINLAVQRASGKDIIVVAGKGHETYQILADRTIDFDDRIEVQKALARRGQN
ncbi:MAG TPA: UDP-N-acetylmuramoyl-L-alanyl-D-glutamate--2,6-diaminopimelate ligase [Chroococcales cyanobacterium]